MKCPIELVIPAHAGIQKQTTGFRVEPGMTEFIAGGSNSRHEP
jgi:hypothetical protein